MEPVESDMMICQDWEIHPCPDRTSKFSRFLSQIQFQRMGKPNMSSKCDNVEIQHQVSMTSFPTSIVC